MKTIGLRACLPVLLMLMASMQAASASEAPNVTLSPYNGGVSASSNVTFACNVTDDGSVFNISFYNNVNGTLSLYETVRIMELENDTDTVLLCRFDDTYECEGGEAGENDSPDFASSRFIRGVSINDSDTLAYPAPGNIETGQGTVEFWFNPDFDPYSPPDDMWLYSTGDYGRDEINIYIDYSGILRFDFHDDSGQPVSAYRNVSSWNAGEWHHMAGIWDVYNYVGSGKIIDLFLDGSNDSVLYSGEYYSYGEFGDTMYLGSYASGTYQADSVFDEFRVSDVPRSPSEINTSYMKGAGNHSKESAEWVLTLPDGIYEWNCLAYDNESQGSWNYVNNTLYVDTSPPVINSVSFYPNSTDDVDPESTVNVTANVTDLVNVSYVILQWKETGSWKNDSMEYNVSTGMYEEASITFEQTGGTYYYRVWSNDTLGHSDHSVTYNVTAEWDYMWSRSPSDLGTAYAIVGCPNCYVGTIVINNTGDDVLSIQMTDNWPLGIYYNVSNPFLIDPKNVTHINVTAEFSTEKSEYPVVINITALHGSETPSPLYQTVSVILNSYSGGPYFDNDNMALYYPTSVYQSMSYNLSALLKNIGNETAAGVWINWTLPAGWTNTSGNASQYVGNLNGTADGGNTAWSNITVYIDPGTAGAGVRNVYVNASSSDNLTANVSFVSYVVCSSGDGVCGAGCSYMGDSNCPSPDAGGTSPAPAPVITAKPAMAMESTSRIDLSRGESGTIAVRVSNTAIGTQIRDVTLGISGYPQVHMKVTPSQIDTLGYGTMPFSVRITVPEYMPYGEYVLSIRAQGTYGNKTIQESIRTTLFVHSATENQTISNLERVQEKLEEMKGLNLDTDYLSTLAEQARNAIMEWDYDSAGMLIDDVLRKADMALRASGLMGELEGCMMKAEKYGMGIPETRKMYSLALAAFHRGDYERAEERAESALLTYSVETYGLVDSVGFMYDNWMILLIMIIVLAAFSWKSHKMLAIRSISGRLRKIETEEKEIFSMIADYQKRYWQDRSVSLGDYEGSISDYGKRLTELMKTRSELTVRRIRMTAKDVLHGLEKELGAVRSMIDDLQHRYFVAGDVSKSRYLMTLNGLNAEMSNIQKSVEMMKSGIGMKPGKRKPLIALILLIAVFIVACLLLLPYAGALGDQDRASEAMQIAGEEIQSMQEMGLGTSYASDTLDEARIMYEQGQYLASESLARKVTEIKNMAIEVNSLIDQVEGMLYETASLGIDVSTAETLFSQSIQAFSIEDYARSGELLTQAINRLDELESEAALKKATQKTWYTETSSFFTTNWILLLAAIAAVVAAVSVLHAGTKHRKAGKSLGMLEEKRRSLEKALIDLQARYFRDSAIGKQEYDRLRDHYRKSLANMEKRIRMSGKK
jgi:hypothetical protein